MNSRRRKSPAPIGPLASALLARDDNGRALLQSAPAEPVGRARRTEAVLQFIIGCFEYIVKSIWQP